VRGTARALHLLGGSLSFLLAPGLPGEQTAQTIVGIRDPGSVTL
jgi:hypothetical protein